MSTISIETVIIGGGPAGLAMSHQLTEAGVEHVIIERGRLAQRWRSERWDSLRLLTPNWQTRLPGWSYTGSDPEGFMTGGEVVDHLAGYGRSFSAPMEEFTEVEMVRPIFPGFEVQTSGHRYMARTVVVATGATDTPAIPGWAADLSGNVEQLPSQWPPGRVSPTDRGHNRRLTFGGGGICGAGYRWVPSEAWPVPNPFPPPPRRRSTAWSANGSTRTGTRR